MQTPYSLLMAASEVVLVEIPESYPPSIGDERSPVELSGLGFSTRDAASRL